MSRRLKKIHEEADRVIKHKREASKSSSVEEKIKDHKTVW